ncbi:SDR family oxidoreductase [Nitrospirillum viridazoti]|uniref:Short-chain dehydrogenase n=1 Tax=Nitrospirillum viridazoti CBAmc TaxID=1441467 RepID=A0A248JTF5_9PROT|nr:SDR family oxidoreductase [Nitrospirillum amazonense]ASG22013.1 short-chain dehydrogenase [Nitrospirillum amazonense CBAmc]TWB42219.1 NAD(P)-dependent dehydrogenase (short-subunit alcohol dehydrogenase family) [Nitrospirillum amazonense]
MARLANKTALITGGTSGIGLETARQFINEGARVAVTGSSAASVAQAREALGDQALVIQADAGDVAGQQAIAAQVRQAFGTLDAVFINAGVADFRPVEAWDEAGFDRSFAVNVKGPYFLIQALLPLLANPASIILNTSINAHIGMPNSSVYAATKAALISMARTLSGELIGRGVRVNAVSPGPISTPLYGKLGLAEADLKAMAAGILAQIPAGRFGDPVEVAKYVVFLASDESRFTVGSELVIDGGMSTL